MAKDNYSYEKHKRELAKKKKREEKMQLRLDRKNTKLKERAGGVGDTIIVVNPESSDVSTSVQEKEPQ